VVAVRVGEGGRAAGVVGVGVRFIRSVDRSVLHYRARGRSVLHMTTTQSETEATWTKIGRKQYRYTDGTVVSYDCNSFMWVIQGTRLGFRVLWAAKLHVEQILAAA
jgi:hypothetical protein